MKMKIPSGFSLPMKTGGGAFATVYRMRQDALERWVAVKVIFEKDAARRKKLLREATTQARLSISCIPQVYDAFQRGANVYIIMEWIKGTSLAHLLEHGELSDIQRVWLADGVIRAVATLHNQGFAHRDIKPANILVSPQNGIFLVDFGFTKDIFNGEKSMVGLVKGTPAYMAPELWKASPDIDYVRADVFSTGLVVRDILKHHAFSSIIDTMLHDDPAQRPENGLEVLNQWDKQLYELPKPHWEYVAGGLTAQNHALNLYEAARILVSQQRIDDAYVLLIECLEENPNLEPALELMVQFPQFTKRKKFRSNVRWSLVAAMLIALTSTSFLIGRISSRKLPTVSDMAMGQVEQPMQLKVRRDLGEMNDFDFRQDSSSISTFSGRLFILSHPADGFLVIDDVAYRDTAEMETGLVLDYGEHVIEWQNDDGRRIWRERMRMLPFQTRSIVIRPFFKEADSHRG